MAPDGDPGVVFRSKPSKANIFHRLVGFLFTQLFRPGSFLSPGPSNSKATVAGDLPSFRRSNVLPSFGDAFVRRRTKSKTFNPASASGVWSRVLAALVPDLSLHPASASCAVRCAIERMQSSERMLERREFRPLAPTALRCRGAQPLASHMHVPFLRRLWII